MNNTATIQELMTFLNRTESVPAQDTRNTQREHAVPCQKFGAHDSRHKVSTFNNSGFCDNCEIASTLS